MEKGKATCLICRGPVVRATRGRPRAYCGAVCRRLAEMAVRRASARLARLELRAADARIGLACTDARTAFGARQRVEAVETEVRRARGELRRLLRHGEE